MAKNEDKKDWVHLTTVPNDIEFEMVAGLLKASNIPVIRSVRGVDGFAQIILGVPISGIDLLVHKDKLQEATEILNADIEEEDFYTDDDNAEREEDKS
ncbi:putative signal transducing protein [Anaerobacterium chartisolvens]|uniref:Putative signal transducing protein n=1 Tax=Anaerobacterium chartisolvens TaxID=1297424 RepID=A0A369B9T7_9FIRM|nr:DUF2007 domain-containing protein [Anaerobacterium chartisolvens]RCX18299.1 putative signal transducing protein [Anaerobacterium chartisolvens]